MVNQSDLPFRVLVRRYGATMAYTQMCVPEKLLSDKDYLEYHIRDITLGGDNELTRPVVAQLCGNNPETIVQAGRKLQSYCDAIGECCYLSFVAHCTCLLTYLEKIDLNLGCPQEAAKEGHFGAYLLGQKDWPLVQDIGTICAPKNKTVHFIEDLQCPQCRTLLPCQSQPSSGSVNRLPKLLNLRSSSKHLVQHGSPCMLAPPPPAEDARELPISVR